MQKEIKQIWFFNKPPEEVWEYLTKPQLIEQWLMKNNFKPEKGHTFQFTFTPKNDSTYEGVVNCEVLELNPFTKLSYSWNGMTKDKTRSFTSIVAWTLVPKNNGTELQLQHNGFRMLEDILTHTSGWNSCINKMEKLINETKNEVAKS
jgi:uncharacterized protein YndB with AHSA1/START domain